jgi:hypothetical protein
VSCDLMVQSKNEHEVWETSRDMARRTLRKYAEEFAGVSSDLAVSFCRYCPAEAKILAALFDASNPGLNHVTARMLTRRANKVRWVVEAERSRGERCGHPSVRSRRSRLVVALAAVALALPAFLSPTHPIAVYAYLLESCIPALIAPAYARSNSSLAEFLISPEQWHAIEMTCPQTCWMTEAAICSLLCSGTTVPRLRRRSELGIPFFLKLRLAF